MSVIAWDGKSVAADKQGTRGDTAMTATKLYRAVNGTVLATAGNLETARVLVDWFNAGAKQEDWPSSLQSNDDYMAEMIAFTKTDAYAFGRLGKPLRIEDKPMAWGSGAELAIGAMAAGASVVRAIEIASRYNVYCGGGVVKMKSRS